MAEARDVTTIWCICTYITDGVNVVEPEDLMAVRQSKLQELIDLDLPALPNRYEPTHAAPAVIAGFAELEGQMVRVAGRLMRVRAMGKASFAHLQDGSGTIQLYFRRDDLGEQKYAYFGLLDLGDVIGVEGFVFATRTGEISIHVTDCVLLAKALRPLPDKFHGLADVETRYRRRYLDLIANEEARRIFRIRSGLVSAIRRYFEDHGFIEVETPILQPIYGGAAATPFGTHYDALDQDVYLRISDELYLKRLIVGGLERVFEISKDFRNEGFSRKHSPEFTMVEAYQAYADYADIMHLMEEMLSGAAESVLGTSIVHFDGHDIDLRPPWRRVTVAEVLREYADVDLEAEPDREHLLEAARRNDVQVAPTATRGKIIDELFSTLVEHTFIQPTFMCDHPVDFPGSMLAKRSAARPGMAERFELFMGGMEIANAFTELNEPGDQRARMIEASALRGDEHQQVDDDYLRALEHGMPPTGGLGFGIDRLTMVLTGAHHVRETILFPLLRPREDDNA